MNKKALTSNSKYWAAALLVCGVAVTVLVAPQGAAAQGTPEQRRACENDAYRLCPDAMPDERRVRACLATFWRKIAGGAAAGGIAMFAENCKVGRICN
jgi:hypothetical protein